jgi:hypothetical protein
MGNANAEIAWKIAVNPASMPSLIAQLPFAKGVEVPTLGSRASVY